MHQERLIRFDGSIIEALPNAQYRVRFANGHEAIAQDSENIAKADGIDLSREFFTVELSSSDLSVGRMIFCSRTPVLEQSPTDHNLNEELSA